MSFYVRLPVYGLRSVVGKKNQTYNRKNDTGANSSNFNPKVKIKKQKKEYGSLLIIILFFYAMLSGKNIVKNAVLIRYWRFGY